MLEEFRKAATIGLKPTESGGFRGYAVAFLNIDRQGHMVLPGAFAKAIPRYLEEGGHILVDHDNRAESVIAKAIDAFEDRRGMLVEGVFSGDDRAQAIRKKASEGVVDKMSAYFFGKATRFNESQIKSIWNNYGYVPSARQIELSKRGAGVITEVDRIAEVSIVGVPANPEAGIVAVKSDGIHEETTIVVAPRIDLAALAQRAALADRILGR